MKIMRKIFVTLVVLVVLPLAVQAMQHGSGAANMDHSKTDHASMNMEGDMIMIGNSVQDGVKAMAHLKDVKDAMVKMGMKPTHHIMVMFVDVATGLPLESGTAAIKVKKADGKQEETTRLMVMQGHFGADIVLPEPGHYHFVVGTELTDGKKRQFEYDFELR
ncbi:MAG: hypothetical protein IH613_01110 [Desulfuromonadales bacterium]|nr:hypothetical protein [Desulfuromonadales bacterium]